MQAELIKTFRFEAAHALPSLPEGHRCRRMHGHSYRVDVHIVGRVQEGVGWVMDFADLKRTVQPVIDRLDHRDLGEVEGLTSSTSEMLAKYIWDHVRPDLPALSAVTVWESDTSRCVYRGA
jgi:6-pyruvoyltetrahydropterin/6-carboxytetrahydropterin synthase